MSSLIDRSLDWMYKARLLIRISLVLGALVLLVAAVVSVWPAEGDRINMLGYSSVCPFAPFSAAILLVMAAASVGSMFVLNKLLRWRERRIQKHSAG